MQIWEQFLENLEKNFGKETVDKWVRSLRLTSFDARNIYLEAEDSFHALWFEEHIRPLSSELRTTSGKPIKIHICLKQFLNKISSSNHTHPSVIDTKLFFPPSLLDPNLSYEHFIFSEENKITLKILSEVVGFDIATQSFSKSLPQLSQYNPIFLYGEEGSGKTHLLTAIALALKKRGITALYVKADAFIDHMIKAIRQGQMPLFRNTYRQAEVLIVDNIEQLSGKIATQEEFFHTFNVYHMEGKQVILASHFPPNKLEKIEPRLISRFEWGITLPLVKLSKNNLPLLLLKKIKLLEYSLNKEVSEYLLNLFDTPKLLCQALEMLSYKSHLDNQAKNFTLPSLDNVKKVIHSLIEEATGKKLSPETILQAVADFFDISKEKLTGKGQTKDIVLPRQLAMYILRQKLGLPYLKIGRLFSKDHSTVISSVKQISQSMKEHNPKVTSNLEELERRLSRQAS